MHINKINNKVYIGKTCQEPEVRFGSNGCGYRACPHFYNAIKKYGWDNFDHKILYEGLSLEEANRLEKQTINQFDSRNPEKGYNIRIGGDGFQSEDSKRLWDDPEYRSRISEINKQIWADEEYHAQRANLYKEQWKDPEKRAKRSKQAVERWANEDFHKKAQAAVYKACATPVRCVETGEVFNAIKDACDKYNNVHHANLCRAIRTGRRCGGYHWEYA